MRLTGKIRYRVARFSKKLILQVEFKTRHWPSIWRDATVEDLSTIQVLNI